MTPVVATTATRKPPSASHGAGHQQSTLANAIYALIEILEAKDQHSIGYARGVRRLAGHIAQQMDLPAPQRGKLQVAALLHDIGRVGLRDDVCHKTSALTPEEQAHVRQHVELGVRILGHLFTDAELLAMVRHHHERYDGAGYPEGLAATQIPVGARILTVADAFVAMTQDRPHRPAVSAEQAVAEVRKLSGKQFCPEVVEALVSCLGQADPETAGSSHPADAPTDRAAAVGDTAAAPGAALGNATADPPEPEEVSQATLSRCVRAVGELKALPNVVNEVMAMTADEDFRLEALVEKIQCDQALSTKVLGLANSAMYTSRMKVESIDRAVVKVGIDGIRHLVLGIGLIDQWSEPSGGEQFHTDFWRHSMGTALLATRIATSAGAEDEQAAFTAGLLHDIGQLILMEALEDQYTVIVQQARASHTHLPKLEWKYLKTDHGELMQSVGHDWRLPDLIVDTISRHHAAWDELHRLEPPVLQLLLSVRMASSVAHALGLGPGTIERIPDAFVHYLKYEKDTLSAFLPELHGEVARLAKAYGLPNAASGGDDPSGGAPPTARPGIYVRRQDSVLDPVRLMLDHRQVDYVVTEQLDAWRDQTDSAWCLVAVESPAQVSELLDGISDDRAAQAAARGDLLALLPAVRRETTEKLAAAGIRHLVEPWSAAVLGDAVDSMRQA